MENGELDGEIDFSSQDFFSNTNIDGGQYLNNCALDDSFFDINDAHACTHTHTCNPPGPDFSHSHTCFHVHTKILPAVSDDDKANNADDSGESVDKKSKKRPIGNREAVRKYREKKKARAASLEDEVVRLRTINQQLVKKLQGQAVLEAEIARLKCLLVDIRGRIEGEIGSFPYQKSAKCTDGIISHQNLPGAYVMNPCELRCDDQVFCVQSGLENRGGETGVSIEQGFGVCDIGNAQCMENFDSTFSNLPDCGRGNVVPPVASTALNKRKGEVLHAYFCFPIFISDFRTCDNFRIYVLPLLCMLPVKMKTKAPSLLFVSVVDLSSIIVCFTTCLYLYYFRCFSVRLSMIILSMIIEK
ncbi:hypothetical protein ACHQM5_017278 [Ranunculus cassubicifolius]